MVDEIELPGVNTGDTTTTGAEVSACRGSKALAEVSNIGMVSSMACFTVRRVAEKVQFAI